MGKQSGGGGSVLLFVILITLGLLMFFGILTFKADDMNGFFNLLRDIWEGVGK